MNRQQSDFMKHQIAIVASVALLTFTPLGYQTARAQPEAVAATAFVPGYAGNVQVGVAIIRTSMDKNRSQRDLRVIISGNRFGSSIVECFAVTEKNGTRNVVLAGKDTCRNSEGYFDFRIESREQLAGWFVRVTNNGRVVGIAQSAEKYRKLAARPATIDGIVAQN